MNQGDMTVHPTKEYIRDLIEARLTPDETRKLEFYVQSHAYEGLPYRNYYNQHLKTLRWRTYNVLYIVTSSPAELTLVGLLQDTVPPSPPSVRSFFRTLLKRGVWGAVGYGIKKLLDTYLSNDADILWHLSTNGVVEGDGLYPDRVKHSVRTGPIAISRGAPVPKFLAGAQIVQRAGKSSRNRENEDEEYNLWMSISSLSDHGLLRKGLGGYENKFLFMGYCGSGKSMTALRLVKTLFAQRAKSPEEQDHSNLSGWNDDEFELSADDAQGKWSDFASDGDPLFSHEGTNATPALRTLFREYLCSRTPERIGSDVIRKFLADTQIVQRTGKGCTKENNQDKGSDLWTFISQVSPSLWRDSHGEHWDRVVVMGSCGSGKTIAFYPLPNAILEKHANFPEEQALYLRGLGLSANGGQRKRSWGVLPDKSGVIFFRTLFSEYRPSRTPEAIGSDVICEFLGCAPTLQRIGKGWTNEDSQAKEPNFWIFVSQVNQCRSWGGRGEYRNRIIFVGFYGSGKIMVIYLPLAPVLEEHVNFPEEQDLYRLSGLRQSADGGQGKLSRVFMPGCDHPFPYKTKSGTTALQTLFRKHRCVQSLERIGREPISPEKQFRANSSAARRLAFSTFQKRGGSSRISMIVTPWSIDPRHPMSMANEVRARNLGGVRTFRHEISEARGCKTERARASTSVSFRTFHTLEGDSLENGVTIGIEHLWFRNFDLRGPSA
jgi:hypothetical protein